MLNLPKGISEDTANAIRRFFEVAKQQQWDKPERALGECTEASDQFLYFLNEEEVEGEIEHYDPKIPKDVEDYPYGDPPLYDCSFHWAVRVSNFVIDWTARQFDADAPFPAIWRARRRPWRNVEHDDYREYDGDFLQQEREEA